MEPAPRPDVLADRVVAATRRTRAALSASLALLLAVAGAVLVFALNRPDRGASTPARAMDADRLAAVYAAALGGRHRADRVTLVLDRLCPSIDPGDCAGRPIPNALRDRIVALTGPGVHFDARPRFPGHVGDPAVVTLGPVHLGRARATVAVTETCGPLCGHGGTMVLVRAGPGWRFEGWTGRQWVS